MRSLMWRNRIIARISVPQANCGDARPRIACLSELFVVSRDRNAVYELYVHERTHAPQQTADHSITSSARASSVAGTSRPSALAVLRLIINSYLVGACTGRSAGFSPLRMRSM